MYAEGEGVPQDYAEAVKWARRAAEQGDDNAQYLLARMYYHGWGVSQNYSEAYVWFAMAAAIGAEDAIKNRDITAEQLSPLKLFAAKRRALKLFEQIYQ